MEKPGRDAALGRGLAELRLVGGDPLPPLPDRPVANGVEGMRRFFGAGAAAAARVAQAAAERRRVEELEQEVIDLRAELRGARAELASVEAATAARVAEADRRAEAAILAERRRTVAGRRMPSILTTD